MKIILKTFSCSHFHFPNREGKKIDFDVFFHVEIYFPPNSTQGKEGGGGKGIDEDYVRAMVSLMSAQLRVWVLIYIKAKHI